MDAATTTQRQTKYCQAIEQTISLLGHATNAELLAVLRKSYPDVSATTVHRATARLASRGTIAFAPAAPDGSMRYDANIAPHDHFQCSLCGILRDTNVKDKVIPILESSIGDCSISGQLTISGTCKHCMKGITQ
jgi:Fe2+ or Zn2+ uptake regulation protein